ncbi:hypothetical protein [Chitinophaga sp. HK235]|uniref:hypothetical protein n=1 Tax=Chitinophaga sp. HK235 TaxID=2952571 RepID=UPI001BAD82E4|nr:hypothetical protein [Chitinophaga sp. HK235]
MKRNRHGKTSKSHRDMPRYQENEERSANQTQGQSEQNREQTNEPIKKHGEHRKGK